MPAPWLSAISPADAARKNTSQSRQKTPVRRSSAVMRTRVVAEASDTPERQVSHALRSPRAARIAANQPSEARTPITGIAHPKAGAVTMAPRGRRLTR
jgi:hypothetical protein